MKKIFYLLSVICASLLIASCGPSPKDIAKEDVQVLKTAIESGDASAIEAAKSVIEEHKNMFLESDDSQDFLDYLNTYKKGMGEMW